MWRVVVCFVALLTGFAILDSQKPGKAQDDSHNQPAATEQNAPTGQVTPPGDGPAAQSLPDHKPAPSQHEKPQEEKGEFWSAKLTDWLLAAFTLALVFFTWRLYKATAGLFTETAGLRTAADQQAKDMKDSIAAAKQSAEAALKVAEISEKALQSLEIPHVYPVDMRCSMAGAGGVVVQVRLSGHFKNFGRSPAILRTASIIVAVTNPKAPRNGPVFKTAQIPFMVGETVGEKETSEEFAYVVNEIIPHADQITNGLMMLNMLVAVSWDDVFGTSRKSSQWFVWNRIKQRFVPGVQLWTEN